MLDAASSAMANATDDMGRLSGLSQKKYVDQAQWFLNAYWEKPLSDSEAAFRDNPDAREAVWLWTEHMCKLDKKRGKEGSELDEFEAHIFLEKNTEAVTVKKMREVLAEIDVDFNQKVSMTEFLIYNYKVDWHYLVNVTARRRGSWETAFTS